MGWTARCVRPPLLLPSCRKLEFRLSALMDSDLAWVNDKSGRQSWRHADAFQHSIISEAIYHLFLFSFSALTPLVGSSSSPKWPQLWGVGRWTLLDSTQLPDACLHYIADQWTRFSKFFSVFSLCYLFINCRCFLLSFTVTARRAHSWHWFHDQSSARRVQRSHPRSPVALPPVIMTSQQKPRRWPMQTSATCCYADSRLLDYSVTREFIPTMGNAFPEIWERDAAISMNRWTAANILHT